VIAKSGTTLIPEMALSQLISDETKLRAVKLAETGPHRVIAFIIRPNYVGTKNIQTLMKVFRNSLEEHFSR
jgi:LysR family hydrogen peroxide-inducible transcriptional activator